MRSDIEITDEVIEAGLASPSSTIRGRRSCRRICFPPPSGPSWWRCREWCANGIRSFRNLWLQRMRRPDIPRDPGWGSASFGAKSYRPYISRAALYARRSTAAVTM